MCDRAHRVTITPYEAQWAEIGAHRVTITPYEAQWAEIGVEMLRVS